ncbi:transposase [Lactobacillus sp. XV13L]|nr:transposase [Lactobacillus sp. XV13L]
MSKYSQELKIKIVKEYLTSTTSYQDLASKYQISSPSIIREWVLRFKSQDLESLRVKHSKRVYSLEQKLAVVEYYETSGQGL